MQMHNVILLVVVFAAAYYLGAKYPGMLAKMGM